MTLQQRRDALSEAERKARKDARTQDVHRLRWLARQATNEALRLAHMQKMERANG